METVANRPKVLVALASALSAALIATAAFLGFPQAGSAAPSRFEAQLALVARLAEREGLGRELRQAAETPAFTNLRKTLPGSLRDSDRQLLELISFLASPRMSRVHQKVASHKRLTSADRRLLSRVIRLLDKNSAIAAIRRRGERLKHDPARLESAWRHNFRAERPRLDPQGTPGSTAFGAIEAALNKPIPSLNNRSISARGAALLASRAVLRYIGGLPPLALGMALPAHEDESAHSSRSICASGSLGPSVRTMLKFGANQMIGDALADIAEEKVGSAVYWDAAFGTRARAWKLFKRFALVTTLSDAVETGKGLADAAWNAVVKCGAASVKLVPKAASRRVGETQLYSLLAEDRDGKSWGGIRADALSVSGGSCHVEQEVCQGEKAGHQTVKASFGRLPPATGSLTVTPGPLHELRVDPEIATVGVGEESPRYEVKGIDSYGNPVTVQIGSFPEAARVRIVPDGRCEQTLAKCIADTSGPHEVIVEKAGVKGAARLEVSSPTVLPTGELYIPYSQQLHARVPVVPGSWRLVPPYASTPYYVNGDGVLAGMALAGGFNPITPGDLGHHTIAAEAVALDGHTLRETYEFDVVAPNCINCAIHVGYRTFTFTWDNQCHICTQNLVDYQLLFEATLPGEPGQYTRYLMNPVLGWGCFGSSQERCAGIYQFGDYGSGVLPGVSVVKLYYEFQNPPYTVVPVGEWTVSVES